MMHKFTLLLTLFLLVCFGSKGQSVGLVLSGGGAKGLYHIGVIRALEQNNIPIDYITGTSMGSIIGGLYAIGYTPDQMEAVFTSEEMKYWMTGQIADKYKYYFKQMNHRAEAFTVRLDFKDKGNVAKINTSIVPSNQLDMAFADYFAPATAHTGGDFDKLFVPFRCVATDATNRREKVLAKGDLGIAIRSSMAIPFVFSPMVVDSALLYDGGLFNNFPWSTMERDFNPDFVIGCSVTPPREANDNSIIEQVMNVTMLHSDYSLPADKGIMIEHKFNDVTTMDFSKVKYIIKAGYDDTILLIDSIKSRISRRVDSTELAVRRNNFKSHLSPIIFDSYTITGLDSNQKSYVRRMLKIKDGEPFTFDQFRSEYFKILSEGEVDGKYPDVKYDETTGRYTLSMKMMTKPSFRVMIGGNISSTALNQAFIGLEYKDIRNNARSYYGNIAVSPFYTSFNPGTRLDFFIHSPFYFEAEVVTNYYNYFRSNFGFLSKNNDLVYLKSEDNYASVSFGLPVERQSVLFLSANGGQDEYQYSQTGGVNDSDTLDRTRLRFLSGKLELERQGTNYTSYTTRGIYQSISVIAVTGRETYRTGTSGNLLRDNNQSANHTWVGARFLREHYFPMNKLSWFSWGYLVDITATTHRAFSNESASNFTSPGFTPTSHSKIIYLKEFNSDSYFAGGLMPTFEFSHNFYLKNSIYAYVPRDYNKVKENIKQKMRYIFDASLVFRTVAGPASLSVSKYDVTQKNNWFITFNFGYTLFNSKGTFY